MKEGKPLAKDLCFVVGLDPQSLPCVERSETFLQFARDIFIHGITSSKIGRIFQGSISLCQTLRSITFSWRNTLCNGRMVRVTGRRRCRMHGGAAGSEAPRGSKNGNYKHGCIPRRWLRPAVG